MKDVQLHFIGNLASGESVEMLRNLKWDEGTVACTRHCWVWALYCLLKQRGLNVSFSYEPKANAINFVHSTVIRGHFSLKDLQTFFFVVIRADFRSYRFGQFEIVQNKKFAGGRRVYMPHIPQPGLIGRNPSRKSVENIGFVGRTTNFVDPNMLSQGLKDIGCKYVFKGEGNWHDLSDIDILLGIRSFSKRPYYDKPPTKLFNAWHARIPFIGGYDSAYEQVGQCGKNYLRASSLEELLRLIRKLKDDQSAYDALVHDGELVGQHYTTERIIDRWVDHIEAEFVPAYFKWTEKSFVDMRRRFMPLFFFLQEGVEGGRGIMGKCLARDRSRKH